MQWRGASAQIKWSFYSAAVLVNYGIQPEPGRKTYRLTATVETSNAFRIAQQPLVLVTPFAGGSRKWSIHALDINNGTVTATLSPIQE